MNKSLIMIGAGVAGLSAGCYGQMNGYRTQIFELHDKPGGLCTSWTRKGYTFDGCIHWLVGSKPGDGLNHIWRELGALQGKQIVDHDEFLRVADAQGKAFILYTNIDRLEQHMKELAPADGKLIDELCRALRRFTRFGEVTGGLGGAFGLLGRFKAAWQMLSFMPMLSRYSKLSTQDFADRFSDPNPGQPPTMSRSDSMFLPEVVK